MFHSKQGKTLIGLLVLVLAVAAVAAIFAVINPASAQAPTVNPPQTQGPPQMGSYPGGTMGMPMPMMMGGPTAIAVSGEYVYITQGNTLYQFSAKTLKLENRTPIMQMQLPSSAAGQAAPQPSH